MIYIFCGNSRSGSTLLYNMGKLILKALNFDYIDMGYKKFLDMGQLQKMEKGKIYTLKTHNPKLIEKENIRYIGVARCSEHVSTEEYKSVVCREKSCSMCLVHQSGVCHLRRMKKN